MREVESGSLREIGAMHGPSVLEVPSKGSMMNTRFLPLLALLASEIVSAEGIFVGAWVGGPSDEPYPQPTKENVESFQTMQGRHLDVVSYFAMFNASWNTTQRYADIASSNGSTLLVTWMANGYSLDDILAGKADARIRAYASGAKKWGREIWLRPLHEANGDWYDWGIGKSGAGNTSEKCIAAWKRIVQVFRDSAVTNVKWVWTTNATNNGPGTSYMGHYPGDDWVDYNSIDGYNWGSSQSWSEWQSFQEVFAKPYALLAKQAPPIFIAEFSSSEKGGDKAEWIAQMFTDLPVKFPRIMGLMWFSQSKEAEGDWAVNTSDAALEAWKKGIGSLAPVSTRESESDLGKRVPAVDRGRSLILPPGFEGKMRIRFLNAQGRMDGPRMEFHCPAQGMRVQLPTRASTRFAELEFSGRRLTLRLPGGF